MALRIIAESKQNFFMIDTRFDHSAEGWATDPIKLKSSPGTCHEGGIKLVHAENAFLAILNNGVLRPVFIPHTSTIQAGKENWVTDKLYFFEPLDLTDIDIIKFLYCNGARIDVSTGKSTEQFELLSYFVEADNRWALKYLLETNPLEKAQLNNLLNLSVKLNKKLIKNYLVSLGAEELESTEK